MPNEVGECKGVLGRLLGHSFQPVYSTQTTVPKVSMSDSAKTVEMFFHGPSSMQETKRTYICSTCKRCGSSVNMKGEPING